MTHDTITTIHFTAVQLSAAPATALARLAGVDRPVAEARAALQAIAAQIQAG